MLRELEPQLPAPDEDDDPAVPASLQARADLALAEAGEDGESVEPAEAAETSFRSLLAELDAMEQGLKSDFEDLPLPALAEADALSGAAGPDTDDERQG